MIFYVLYTFLSGGHVCTRKDVTTNNMYSMEATHVSLLHGMHEESPAKYNQTYNFMVENSATSLLIGLTPRPPRTSTMCHLGEGVRPCWLPVTGNEHRRLLSPNITN